MVVKRWRYTELDRLYAKASQTCLTVSLGHRPSLDLSLLAFHSTFLGSVFWIVLDLDPLLLLSTWNFLPFLSRPTQPNSTQLNPLQF